MRLPDSRQILEVHAEDAPEVVLLGLRLGADPFVGQRVLWLSWRVKQVPRRTHYNVMTWGRHYLESAGIHGILWPWRPDVP